MFSLSALFANFIAVLNSCVNGDKTLIHGLGALNYFYLDKSAIALFCPAAKKIDRNRFGQKLFAKTRDVLALPTTICKSIFSGHSRDEVLTI